MALLIGDIGGSSSRWIISTQKGCSEEHRLPGFNPTQGDPSALLTGLGELSIAKPERVIVYGAGCGHPTRKVRMSDALCTVWPATHIEVDSDLMGAARGLYGHESGIVLILGTGMNAGYYDGKELHTPMPSLGYLLGDEGSGADLGKTVLIDALHGRAPASVKKAVFEEGINMEIIARELYRGKAPQAWLASFARPLLNCLPDPYVEALLRERFSRMAGLIATYFGSAGREVRASGSIAYAAKDPLSDALRAEAFELTVTERSPLAGLVRYHAEAAR